MSNSIILFDLDGTLADLSHRLHHIEPPKKNWDAFFEDCHLDLPHLHICELLRALGRTYEIWVVSGRSDQVRGKTLAWLDRHQVAYHKLIMRKAGDFTEDDVLKISWLTDGTIPKERVLCVFEDRKKVVDAWRKEGIPVMHVAEGNF